MTYFIDIISENQLKSTYRQLVKSYHPDRGGDTGKMQEINREYDKIKKCFNKIPCSLKDIEVGHVVYVNTSKCYVTYVEEKLFKVRAIESKREAFFDRSTGLGIFNFRIRVAICN